MGPQLLFLVIGAGAAGFYVIEELLQLFPNAVIHLVNDYVVPGGLAEFALAPDHSVAAQIAEWHALLRRPNVHYFGNCWVGARLQLERFANEYTAIFATLGARQDTKLGKRGSKQPYLDGELLPGVLSSTTAAGWYTAGQLHHAVRLNLAGQKMLNVGGGEVSMDMSRIFLANPASLRPTRISRHALRALEGSQIEEVIWAVRRGPTAIKFKIPSLKELERSGNIDIIIDPAELRDEMLDPFEYQVPAKRAMVERLREIAQRGPTGKPRRVRFLFARSPVRFISSDGRVSHTVLCRNRRVIDEGRCDYVPTDVLETVPSDLVVKATGYRSGGMIGLPYDARNGVCPNDGSGRVRPGVYTAGWFAFGANTTVALNKRPAHKVVGAFAEDLATGRVARRAGSDLRLQREIVSAGMNSVDAEAALDVIALQRRLGRDAGCDELRLSPAELRDELGFPVMGCV